MPRYGARTVVSAEKSRAEIEQTLRRYGADGFRYGWYGWMQSGDTQKAQIDFTFAGRLIRFVLAMPSLSSDEITLDAAGRKRSHTQRARAWDQTSRQRWRILLLAIKAKLEAVECGLASFEQEFLAYVVDPQSQKTVAELVLPQLSLAYEGRKTSLLLAECGGCDD